MDFIEDLQIFGYLRGHSYRECWRWPREITTGDSCRDQAIEGGGDTWGALGETALGSWSQHSNASGAGKWRHSVAKVVLSTPQYPRKIMENPYFSTIKANLIWYVVILRLLETSFFSGLPAVPKTLSGNPAEHRGISGMQVLRRLQPSSYRTMADRQTLHWLDLVEISWILLGIFLVIFGHSPRNSETGREHL